MSCINHKHLIKHLSSVVDPVAPDVFEGTVLGPLRFLRPSREVSEDIFSVHVEDEVGGVELFI